MIQTRPAKLNDSDAISVLSHQLGYPALPPEIASTNLQTIINSTLHDLTIAEFKGQISGWIHSFIAHRLASRAFVEIGGLVVDAKLRRKGIGHELLVNATQWAQSQQMHLRVRCNRQREEAIAFYRANGFNLGKDQSVLEFNPGDKS